MPVDAKRVQSAFLAAIEISDRVERSAALDRLCGGDAELRRRVELLLQAHDQPESLPHAFDKPLEETVNPPAMILGTGAGLTRSVWPRSASSARNSPEP